MEPAQNQLRGRGPILVIILGGITALGVVTILACAGLFFYSAGAINRSAAGPAAKETVETAPPPESIPGIVDNIDRKLDQVEELGGPVDRERSEKLKRILGDLTGSKVNDE